MAAFERIVIEAEPGYKKKLKEIAVLTDKTMKDVILEYIDLKHAEVLLQCPGDQENVTIESVNK